MSSLLYYSISSNLTKDEIIEINKQIAKNRETVKNFALNARDKTRKVIVIILLGGALYFSNVQPSEVIGLSMPPAPIIRVQPSYQYNSKVQIANIIPRKKNLILYKSPKQILFLIYLTYSKTSSNQEVLKLVKKLRRRSWGLVRTVAVLGLIILILSMGEGFVHNIPNPGWRLYRPNPFQPPISIVT